MRGDVRRALDGFILVDVLAASTVLGLGIALMLGSVHHSLEALRIAEETARALAVLEERAALWQAGEPIGRPPGGGARSAAGEAYAWELTGVPATLPNVSAARLTVRWRHRRQARVLSTHLWWLRLPP